MARENPWVQAGKPRSEREAFIVWFAMNARHLAKETGDPNLVLSGLLTSLIPVAADGDVDLGELQQHLRELADSLVAKVKASRLANAPGANPPGQPI